MSILDKINSPSDVKELNNIQTEMLCADIRKELIEIVSKTGGHLASNLGVVELTVALHKIFSTPVDNIIWDVGHQCYVHKMLTGRRDRMMTIRQKDGLSGFPKPNESIHDSFISGHSSTSVSVAYGLAKAKKLKNEQGKVIAVIGDGALSGGLSFEGLNNVGRDKLDNIIIIVNDNKMSISKNVGSLAKYLTVLRNDPKYFRAKDSIGEVLDKIPVLGEPTKLVISKVKSSAKGALYKSNFFEDLGFAYLGPVDGHNTKSLCDVLKRASCVDKPVLIYVNTTKGKGYTYAEKNPGAFHGISGFNIETGNPDILVDDSFSRAMGLELVSMARQDKTICAVTAAMKYGTELQHFAKEFKDRFFDVGIAEAHGVAFAASMAHGGMKPIFAVYSSFLQRAYDQIIHDVAISSEHVVFAIDRAGIVGQDGETHQGLFDVGFLSTVPGMTVFSPSNYDDLRRCMHSAFYEYSGPVAIRYPRGSCSIVEYKEKRNFADNETFYMSRIAHSKTLLISYGNFFNNLHEAWEVLEDTQGGFDLLKLTKILPIDEEVISRISKYDKIIFFEETVENGSIGQQLISKVCAKNPSIKYFHKCFDGFIPQATPDQIYSEWGFNSFGMLKYIKRMSENE